jgi:hypothetical protein
MPYPFSDFIRHWAKGCKRLIRFLRISGTSKFISYYILPNVVCHLAIKIYEKFPFAIPEIFSLI